MVIAKLYSESYTESRDKFYAALEQVRLFWPKAEIRSYALGKAEDNLAVEVIAAPALVRQDKVLLLTSGLHGIEGYIGSAVTGLFIDEFLEILDPSITGLYIVHAINPWGMWKRRRTNENNVDLNRNFIYGWEVVDTFLNYRYDRINPFLNPANPVNISSRASFGAKLAYKMLPMGAKNFKEVMLMGQYHHPKGIYYGGKGSEASTQIMINLFKELAASCQRLLTIDMHSGYGPRYQMTIVNSIHEPRDSLTLRKAFGYPLVAKTSPLEFYAMQGDMVDFFYELVSKEFPKLSFYGTSFEFGTLGESPFDKLRSLKAMIDENRLFHYGALSPELELKVREAFNELFIPQEQRWRDKALQDAKHALSGILHHEGYRIN